VAAKGQQGGSSQGFVPIYFSILEDYEKILQCIGIASPEFNIAIFAQTSYCNKIYLT
jgi:hypothetical protein